MEFSERLNQINQNFKLARIGLQIEARGEKLYVRGTLPPKPQSQRFYPHQQRISLHEPTDMTGLALAERQMKLIAAQLLQNTFQWQDYIDRSSSIIISDHADNSNNSLLSCLTAFEKHFWATRGHGAQTTWRTAYAPYLNKLKAIALVKSHLSHSELIYQAILSTAANTRSRQICCTAIKSLSDFMQLTLPFDLQSLSGNYSHRHLKQRELPDDQAIASSYHLIPNDSWRFVYGVMATFGLRNHEVFFTDYSNIHAQKPTIQVLETTKTGRHEVWGFLPEWIDEFKLKDLKLPPLNTDLKTTTLQKIGQQVTRQFQRYDIPFSPYDLRHAWAVRTIHFGLPDPVAAQMMGHSVAIHTRTYHRWITHRDQQQAVDAALQRTNNK